MCETIINNTLKRKEEDEKYRRKGGEESLALFRRIHYFGMVAGSDSHPAKAWPQFTRVGRRTNSKTSDVFIVQMALRNIL